MQQIPSSQFILFVSTIERRKNHRLLCDIYAEMADHAGIERWPMICMVGMVG